MHLTCRGNLVRGLLSFSTFIDSIFVDVGKSYVYYTQVMQAETLAAAYRLWRRNWKGRGREYTAGALVWQVCTNLVRAS